MFGAPECLPVFGARTFPTVITTSTVQNLNEKIAAVGVACFVAEPWSCFFSGLYIAVVGTNSLHHFIVLVSKRSLERSLQTTTSSVICLK
jgi:hypothetical protein